MKRQSAGTDLEDRGRRPPSLVGDGHGRDAPTKSLPEAAPGGLRQSHPFPLPKRNLRFTSVRHHARRDGRRSKFASASFMVDLEDGLRDLGPLVGIDGRTEGDARAPADGRRDMVRDARSVKSGRRECRPAAGVDGHDVVRSTIFRESRPAPTRTRSTPTGPRNWRAFCCRWTWRRAVPSVRRRLHVELRAVRGYLYDGRVRKRRGPSRRAELLSDMKTDTENESALRAAVPHRPRGREGSSEPPRTCHAATFAESDAADLHRTAVARFKRRAAEKGWTATNRLRRGSAQVLCRLAAAAWPRLRPATRAGCPSRQ